jgi:hypothetical protein
MKENKETKRIQFTNEELKTLEFHLGNELETWFEMLKEADETKSWEDYNEWRPTWLLLDKLYGKIFNNTKGIVGSWRWWCMQDGSETWKY